MTSELLDDVEDAITAIAAGEMVIVVDDTDRENEGDLIIAASKATSQSIGFMIRHTSGIICAPIAADRAEALRFDPMVGRNSDPMGTAFTVSVDYRPGLTTGISAKERAATVRAIANQNAQFSDFARPGHVFPLVAKAGGVLVRSGHTEAGVDLATLAGLEPVAAIAEVVDEGGEPMRFSQLVEFAREHKLKIISIEDLIAFRMRREKLVRCVSERQVRIRQRAARVKVYGTDFDHMQHVAFVFGEVEGQDNVIARIHREQPIRDVTDGDWFETAFREIEPEGRGLMLLLRAPQVEGEAQEATAAEAPDGFAGEEHRSADSRRKRWKEVGIGAQILRDLGVKSISLLETEGRSYVGIGGFGIDVSDVRQLV